MLKPHRVVSWFTVKWCTSSVVCQSSLKYCTGSKLQVLVLLRGIVPIYSPPNPHPPPPCPLPPQ